MTGRSSTGPESVNQAVPLILSRMTAQLTCMTLIFEADSPVLILTVSGTGIPSAMPATRRPSLVGLRSRAAPRPLLVASAHKCVLLPTHFVCPTQFLPMNCVIQGRAVCSSHTALLSKQCLLDNWQLELTKQYFSLVLPSTYCLITRFHHTHWAGMEATEGEIAV